MQPLPSLAAALRLSSTTKAAASPGFRTRLPVTPLLVMPLAIAVTVAMPALAADVTAPAPITNLTQVRGPADVTLTWPAVTQDVTGNPETVAEYRIYRGTIPSFVPDKFGGTNRIGTAVTPTFVDTGAAAGPTSYYYLVSTLDASGNESGTRDSTVTTPPVTSGSWTDTSIDLTWTAAQPAGEVQDYRVYCGQSPGNYDQVFDAGLSTAYSLTTLQTYVQWFCSVTAVDMAGNESAFSNEHIDEIAGRVRVRAHDDDYLCWLSGGASCPPLPGRVQRNDGFQLMVPTTFPIGTWNRVLLTFTMDSRLCVPPLVPDKCGSGNPGGYNPCGDPFDRIAQVFLVLDSCIQNGGSCITPLNLELMRAITPFGTDAPPPDGTGKVPPRALTLDVTPYAPLLTGTKYIGAEIAHYVQAGWHVTTELEFSERPDEISPDPPADGFDIAGFGSAPLPVHQVTIPAGATKVVARLFTSGHGGSLYCDGGTNDGAVCTGSANCPGGTCQACDEFCHRVNRILVNGNPVYQTVPYRNDCSPGSNTACRAWNACGWPSCTFPRAGWCPGYIACPSNAPGCGQDIDFTALLPPGGTYDVGYDVLVQRGYWPVSLVLYWYY